MNSKKHIELRKVVLSIFVLLLLLANGCNFLPSEPYVDVQTFDIGSPVSICPRDVTINVKRFGNESACKYKMLYRSDKTRVMVDDYNRWTQPPGMMLTRYLQLAFSNDNDYAVHAESYFEITGNVLVFETSLADVESVLAVEYQIRDRAGELLLDKSRIFRTPYKKMDSEAFSKAMMLSAAKLSKKIKEDILHLPRGLSKVN